MVTVLHVLEKMSGKSLNLSEDIFGQAASSRQGTCAVLDDTTACRNFRLAGCRASQDPLLCMTGSTCSVFDSR